MMQDAPSWAVVATVDEPLVLVQAFVAWHLALGAQQITLYFDRPDHPAADIIAQIPQVQVVRCGPDHWAQRHGGRPAKHQVRQVHNATHAYRNCQADWLLHCDADEYLWPETTVAAELNMIPALYDGAIVPVAERIYLPETACKSIFEGAFRRPFAGPTAMGRRLFGPDYAMTRLGLTGHVQGKAFARADRGLELSVHRPKPKPDLQLHDLRGLVLLHFDGLTQVQWVFKLLRKAAHFAHHDGMEPSPHRQKQINALIANPAAAGDLHDRLKCLPARSVMHLRANGLLVAPHFDPAGPTGDLFGAVDMSVAGFNAALLRAHATAYPDIVRQLAP